MMRLTSIVLIAIAFAGRSADIRADDAKKAVLDTVADERLLDTRFVRFGPVPKKAIVREGRAIRFHLPPLKDPGHSGLYSYVALAGDFEITASYTWAGVPVPKVGYGASCGIAVDTKGPAGSVALARATLPAQSAGYIVTRAVQGPSGMTYDTTHTPTKAMSGRLALRREKKELVCLAGDGDKSDLVELCRLPFTDATVREVRIYADPGGSETGLDARIFNFRVVAEEITGGIPERDKYRGLGWWPWIAAVVLGGGAWLGWRRWKRI